MADTYDVIVIGGGAAATSAALTLLNRGKTVGVVCNKAETSSLYKAEKVTNYPWINLIRAGAMALVVLILGLKCGTNEFLAMLMVVPVFLYQDTPAVPKRRHLFRSNYLIYPAHLALYALAIVLPYLLSKGKPLF